MRRARLALALVAGGVVLLGCASRQPGMAPALQLAAQPALGRRAVAIEPGRPARRPAVSPAPRRPRTCATSCARAERRARSCFATTCSSRAADEGAHAATPPGAQSPPLICVDQEGGAIRILRWVGPTRSAPEQRAAGTETGRRKSGRARPASGRDQRLARAGRRCAERARRGARRTGRSRRIAGTAGDSVAAAVRGWREGGVAPTVKHFPGLGGATSQHRPRSA